MFQSFHLQNLGEIHLLYECQEQGKFSFDQMEQTLCQFQGANLILLSFTFYNSWEKRTEEYTIGGFKSERWLNSPELQDSDDPLILCLSPYL